LPSLSRVMSNIVDNRHKMAATKLRLLLSSYEKCRDLIMLGAYKHGSDPEVDLAIKKLPIINAFLQQPLNECTNYHQARAELLNLI